MMTSILTGCGCDHKWQSATCEEPKTCKLCGETEGEPYMKRAINEDMCVAIEDTKDHHLKVTFYNLNGNVVHEHDLNLNRSDGGYDGWIYSFVKDGYMLATGNENKTEITVYDYDFNTIMEKRLDAFLCNGNPNNTAELDSNSFDGINRVYNKNKETTYFAVDFNNGCFVGTKDEKSWGFIDLDGNEIRMYKDATDFTRSGYALVSEGGKSYDLNDTDMNVVKEGIVEAKGASIYENTSMINVFNEDGSEDHFLVQ